MKQAQLVRGRPREKLSGALVDVALYEKVRKAAKEDRRSVSDYLRLLIEREIERKSA